jgi:hypothetical protein
MGRVLRSAILATTLAVAAAPLEAQRKPPARRTPARTAKPAPPQTVTPEVKCPSLIGMGVKTVRSFCDVPVGREAAQGIIVVLPRHAGPGTLTFDLHARHVYSEDEMKRGKAYARYRAGIAVATMTGEVLARGGVETEFRTAADLFDRIGGGAGPGTLKAVAPAGRESIVVTVPANVDQVSLVGETLDALTPAGRETAVMAGRPIAIVSNVLFEYRPAPVKR